MGDVRHKTASVEIKAAPDGEAGEFEALVAVFGNVDSHGDRVERGAFRKSLRKWRASGDPIPVVLSHKWDDPYAHIGVADPADVEETADGLLVKGRLDIGENDVAAQVHRLMLRRSLKEFSFGYTVPKGGETHDSDEGVWNLSEINLIEVGPTLKGANPETELRAVKSALEETREDEPDEDSEPDDADEAPDEPEGKSRTQAELTRRIIDAQFESRGIPAGNT